MIYFYLYIDGKNSDQYNSPSFAGGIAQLGERLHGMQEVSGSIPLTSTSLWQYHKLTVNSFKYFKVLWSPSSRGLGHHPFTVSTGVRIPLGTPRNPQFLA